MKILKMAVMIRHHFFTKSLLLVLNIMPDI